MMYLLKRLDNRQMGTILPQMVRGLIRTKRLSLAFLDGYLMVAIDATGIFSSPRFHCKQCLTQQHKDGTVTYMHLIPEAKIISRDGMALSLLSEPIENPKQGNYDKQDCELKAFKRLAKRLKELFPRQKIVLLVDSDYAGAPFFTICNDNQWQFICTFKPGSIPTLFEEAMALLELEKDNAIVSQDNGARNIWRWLDYLPYHVGKHEFQLGFFDYRETGKGDDRYFSWLTGFTPSRDNVRKLTKGGRRRWLQRTKKRLQHGTFLRLLKHQRPYRAVPAAANRPYADAAIGEEQPRRRLRNAQVPRRPASGIAQERCTTSVLVRSRTAWNADPLRTSLTRRGPETPLL
jgi:hypothetical protein